MSYYSENGEDEYLDQKGALPTIGVYVDIGAADPFVHSHTAFLRAKGWTGLAVDGDPRWRERWMTPLVTAIVHPVAPVGFYMDDNPFNSRVDISLPPVFTRSLEGMLMDAGIEHVDVMNISTNGADFWVWKSMVFDRHTPDAVIQEFVKGTPNPLADRLQTHYDLGATTFDTMVWFRRR